jgi:hypothetical protein
MSTPARRGVGDRQAESSVDLEEQGLFSFASSVGWANTCDFGAKMSRFPLFVFIHLEGAEGKIIAV